MSDNIIHVSPIVGDDDKEHDTANAGACWCHPKPLHEPKGVIWVHNDLRAPKRPETIARSA